MVLGLITTTIFSLKSGLEEEAMDGLELLSGAVQSSYEDIKGNYEYKNGRLFKGGEELTIKPAALIYMSRTPRMMSRLHLHMEPREFLQRLLIIREQD